MRRITEPTAEQKYDEFLRATKLYSQKLSEQDRLVLRVTRIFGECELAMPPDYVNEVKKGIGYWQSNDKLKRAIALAQAKGYASPINGEFLAQGLPPQFFYLALQESARSVCLRTADLQRDSQGHVAIHPRDRGQVRT